MALPTPDLWWDASDTGSITDSGGDVSQWNDLSGNAAHFVQATGIRKPKTAVVTQNGLNTISFDPTSNVKYMDVASSVTTSSQPYWVFMVCMKDANCGLTGSSAYALSWGSGDAVLLGSTIWQAYAGGANTIDSGATPVDNQFVLLTAKFNGSSSLIRVDEANTSTNQDSTHPGNNSFSGAPHIGSYIVSPTNVNYQLGGAIGEIRVYYGDVGTTNAGLIEAELMTKWGLNLTAWYDASDTGSITDSGGDVSQWNDLSGNGYNFVQATAANKPKTAVVTQNSLNTISFDPTVTNRWLESSALSYSQSQPYWMFIVCMKDANSGSGGAQAWILAWNGVNRIFLTSSLWQAYANGAGNISSNATPVDGTFVLLSIKLDGANSLMRVNTLNPSTDQASGYPGTDPLDGDLFIGAYPLAPTNTSYRLGGAIGEIQVWRTDIGDAAAWAIEAALLEKWGLKSFPVTPGIIDFTGGTGTLPVAPLAVTAGIVDFYGGTATLPTPVPQPTCILILQAGSAGVG